jgi:hypothetical protein
MVQKSFGSLRLRINFDRNKIGSCGFHRSKEYVLLRRYMYYSRLRFKAYSQKPTCLVSVLDIIRCFFPLWMVKDVACFKSPKPLWFGKRRLAFFLKIQFAMKKTIDSEGSIILRSPSFQVEIECVLFVLNLD